MADILEAIPVMRCRTGGAMDDIVHGVTPAHQAPLLAIAQFLHAPRVLPGLDPLCGSTSSPRGATADVRDYLFIKVMAVGSSSIR